MLNRVQEPAANHLAGETSPYLLQHLYNPVDWYPWGPQALEKARREDKPILLSIGYSACHWCHVMAHESFEDPDTARVMNRLFVNIKVDREERPDLDKIYQSAHQVLTRRPGGWPLTVLLDATDQTPFFSGTYFPREARYGMPSFVDLVLGVEAYYRQNRAAIREQDATLKQVLDQIGPATGAQAAQLNTVPLQRAREQLAEAYDRSYGGFGVAPKFPQPGMIARLLRRWADTRRNGSVDDEALDMAVGSLRAMARGGLYDHLGGGFFRYSVDARWEIPHFEKMLYDNALLLSLYADAWVATGDPELRRVAEETGDWVLREMEAVGGGYYSSLDADSDGKEGAYYIWTRDEVRAVLELEEYRAFARFYGLDSSPNFDDSWHLRLVVAPPDDERTRTLLTSARTKLRKRRAQRTPPGRDEKVLTAWNGLAIKALAGAGRRLGREDWLASAARALAMVRGHLVQEGRLLAAYASGQARLNAYLDDQVFLADAIIELLQARWREDEFAFLLKLLDTVLTRYQDEARGGFYFTSDDHEQLIHRPRPLADEALPSGNGIAVQVLSRIGYLLGEPRYLEAAERTLKLAWKGIDQNPLAYLALLQGLEDYLRPGDTVVLRGAPSALAPWTRRAARHYAPQRLVLAIPGDAGKLPGALAERRADEGIVAYVCQGTSCRAAITEPTELEQYFA